MQLIAPPHPATAHLEDVFRFQTTWRRTVIKSSNAAAKMASHPKPGTRPEHSPINGQTSIRATREQLIIAAPRTLAHTGGVPPDKRQLYEQLMPAAVSQYFVSHARSRARFKLFRLNTTRGAGEIAKVNIVQSDGCCVGSALRSRHRSVNSRPTGQNNGLTSKMR
ncbi:hypothetical protein EVAR_59208_1 [Eumeta japonica]|uniref:Uncharacterized protein n=1 Tax=Eumeta variegata TaxID=151549 RepID=A0A4C1YX08_EUMVA|nr:hypothetical protein EVAR_59208_1 [Eumeta japonica]